MTESDNCPIKKEARKELLQHVIRRDWERAAQIYHKNSKKQIYPRYLERFLRCYSNPTGRNPKSHQPLQMFDAIASAVAERQEAERQQTAHALEILSRKIHIGRPTPIAL